MRKLCPAKGHLDIDNITCWPQKQSTSKVACCRCIELQVQPAVVLTETDQMISQAYRAHGPAVPHPWKRRQGCVWLHITLLATLEANTITRFKKTRPRKVLLESKNHIRVNTGSTRWLCCKQLLSRNWPFKTRQKESFSNMLKMKRSGLLKSKEQKQWWVSALGFHLIPISL